MEDQAAKLLLIESKVKTEDEVDELDADAKNATITSEIAKKSNISEEALADFDEAMLVHLLKGVSSACAAAQSCADTVIAAAEAKGVDFGDADYGTVLAGTGWSSDDEVSGMSSDDQRNSIISNVHNRLGLGVEECQGMNEHKLLMLAAGAAAGAKTATLFVTEPSDEESTYGNVLVEVGSCTPEQAEQMGEDGTRNSVISWIVNKLGRDVSDLQGMDEAALVSIVKGVSCASVCAVAAAEAVIATADAAGLMDVDPDYNGTLVRMGWRTEDQVGGLSEDDSRNTVLHELVTRCRLPLADAQEMPAPHVVVFASALCHC